jgi:hypothetical protein
MSRTSDARDFRREGDPPTSQCAACGAECPYCGGDRPGLLAENYVLRCRLAAAYDALDFAHSEGFEWPIDPFSDVAIAFADPATVADRAECQKCGAGKYSTLSIIDGLCMECAELSSITLPQPKVQP